MRLSDYRPDATLKPGCMDKGYVASGNTTEFLTVPMTPFPVGIFVIGQHHVVEYLWSKLPN